MVMRRTPEREERHEEEASETGRKERNEEEETLSQCLRFLNLSHFGEQV
jgi:hypothetical protein